jgi:DNA polymerase-1
LSFNYRPEVKRYEIVDSVAKLLRLRNKLMQVDEFAFDTETNSLRANGENKDFKVVGISISWGAYHNYYIPMNHVRDEDIDNQVSQYEVWKYLKKPFERTDVRLIGSNIKFDMHVMMRIGIHIKTLDLFDVMIASWLCDENSPNGLKENSQIRLGLDQEHFKEVVETVPKEVKKRFGLKANSKATFDMVLIKDGAQYAIDDAFNTWELYLGYLDELESEKMGQIYYKVYTPFIRTLFKMEEHGVTVDLDRIKELSKELTADMEELEYQLFELAGVEFNPSSDQQLGELLFGYQKPIVPPWDKTNKDGDCKWDEMTDKQREKAKKDYEKKLWEQENSVLLKYSFKFRVISKTKNGAPQTNADVLWKLSHLNFKDKRKRDGVEFCRLLMDYKKLDKLKNTFVDGILEQLYDDGKVHATFNIIGATSGRLSCKEPNLQQLPKADEEDKYQIRSIFIGSISEKTGKRKKIISLDQSNLEIRVTAHFSEDKLLLQMFAEGQDVHGSTAVNMFELECTPKEVKKLFPHLRQAAKVLNFLLIYGGGAYNLYTSLRDAHNNPIDLGDKKYLDIYHVKSGEEVAQIYIDKYFDSYEGVADFVKKQKRFAHKYGFVYTLLERKRRLPDINSTDWGIKAYCERLSVNSPVQGSAADIIMCAQNRIDTEEDVDWLEEREVFMLIQVHDELVFESPEEYVEEAIPKIKRYMEHPFGDDVELNLALVADAGYGDNYQEAK